MKVTGLKLSKFELMLTLSIVLLIGGPISYRFYQIYNLFANDSTEATQTVRVALSMNKSFSLQEYVPVAVEPCSETSTANIPTDWSSRLFSRLSLQDFTVQLTDNNDELINVTFDSGITPMYSFNENILLFGKPDNPAAAEAHE